MGGEAVESIFNPSVNPSDPCQSVGPVPPVRMSRRPKGRKQEAGLLRTAGHGLGWFADLVESVSQGHMYRDRILIEPIKPDWKMETSSVLPRELSAVGCRRVS